MSKVYDWDTEFAAEAAAAGAANAPTAAQEMPEPVAKALAVQASKPTTNVPADNSFVGPIPPDVRRGSGLGVAWEEVADPDNATGVLRNVGGKTYRMKQSQQAYTSKAPFISPGAERASVLPDEADTLRQIHAAHSVFGDAVPVQVVASVNQPMRTALARLSSGESPDVIADVLKYADTDDEVNLAMLALDASPTLSASEARVIALSNSGRSRGSREIARMLEPRARQEYAAALGDGYVRARREADLWTRKFMEPDVLLENQAYDAFMNRKGMR